ncbi:MAG: efflux RND transporter permease subunit, partial [Pseudomonadota bacterium]
MAKRLRSGGIAAWSIRRPIAVTMLALAIVVPGLVAMGQLHIDLLPKLIYPNIRVRVIDSGVPAPIMEDQVTRQLEEQLAITEGAVAVESFTRKGRSAVDLSFPYGTDIDTALRDASNRLDRAKRFLPETIDPPIIYKLDPSQIPVLELVVSSGKRNISDLYEWADYLFSKSLINLPGVASVEVGGGQAKEISIEIDQERLAAAGLTFKDISELIDAENRDTPGGRLVMANRELNTRVAGRFTHLSDLQYLPLRSNDTMATTPLLLGEVADIQAGHGAEELRIRVDGVPGIKLSVQKQPQANTVAVVDGVLGYIEWMKTQGLLPQDVLVKRVNDQAAFIRHALRNAAYAAGSGAVLAMMVVFLFLGNLRRT